MADRLRALGYPRVTATRQGIGNGVAPPCIPAHWADALKAGMARNIRAGIFEPEFCIWERLDVGAFRKLEGEAEAWTDSAWHFSRYGAGEAARGEARHVAALAMRYGLTVPADTRNNYR